MNLLKTTLLLLLSLCVLGYGSAWAFDGHVIAADSNETGILFNAGNHADAGPAGSHSDEDHGGSQSCDHCCHISAHIQAIFSQNDSLTFTSPSAERLDYSEHFISYIVSPDLRPPRV